MRIKPIIASSVVAGALTLLFQGHALALGLGKLTVESSLGQPLSARIELTSATKEELDSLTAKIADSALYKQNNLAYQSALARSRVTLERTANGQAYLNVVTQTAVNEPYLDLMVEMNWAAGRLVRQYTFLLDPPGVPSPPVEPMAPVRIGAAPPPPPAAAPVAAPAAPAATAPAAPRVPSAASAAGGSYAVKRGDTLSGIAGEHKPPNVSLEQMLVALFKNNQAAFDGSNINRLRAGAIMTIPSADEAAATTPAEAANVVRLQAADWRAYRDRVAAGAPMTEGAGSRAGSGKIGTVVEESVPAAPAGRDQLRVSRETASGKGGTGAAAETAIARDKQIKEQQERIADLEKTVRDLQRVAELKSQALAQLQAQADQAKGLPPKAAAPTPAPPVPAPETKALEAAKAAPAEAPKVAPPVATQVTPPVATQVTPPAAKQPEAPSPAPASAPKADQAPSAKAVPPKTAPPSMMDDLMANIPTWAIGGVALVVLGGIAALIAARRRKSPKFDDTMATDTDIKSNTVFGSTGGGVVNTGDNSLSSEFSREGLGNIDTDEVDPIAEAEVYLAYGRDAQAEEILKDAVRKDPQRQEVYLKLLEIHAQHNKPSAFETVAAELYSVSQGQGDVWQKAVALGLQLDPNNPMFAAGHGAATGGAGLSAGDTQTFSVPPELTTEVSLPPDKAAAPPRRVLESIDDLGLDADMARSAMGAKTKTAQDILAGAESELQKSTRESSSGGAALARTSAAAATAALVEGIAKAKPVTEAPAADKVEASGLPDLEFRLDDAPPAKSAPASTAATPDFDSIKLSFDDDRSTFEDATPSVLDGQWHDAATKLDLAKAYQEMGDVEGAREILQEVLREGDDGQKKEAQALITTLG